MRREILLLALGCGLLDAAALSSATVHAAEPKAETVLGGLNNPLALAIQPETGVVFLSESGAGNVVRVQEGKSEPVLTGSKVEELKLGAATTAGPLGLAFFDKNTLLVGDGGYGPGADCIRVFTLPEPGKTVPFDMPKEKLGPLAAADTNQAEGKYRSLVATKFAVFASAAGDPTKGWLVRSEVSGTKYAELKRFVATTEAGAALPGGITISPRGEVVVGQFTESGASQLSFYNANNGKLLLRLPTQLAAISGLAYAPKTGFLYALDFGVAGTGGLYRLDSAREGESQKLVGTKIVELARPTALAFAADGTLYLTVLGPNGAAPAGQLLKIAPGL